jgi:hypothetical protein
MEKKSIAKIILLIAGVLILAGGLWYWTSLENEATPINSSVILFYGRECSHCQDLDKFLAENQMAEKIQFDRLEVFHNPKNRAILTEKAKKCGIENEQEIGVPFLYDIEDNKCFTGTPEIEDFFVKKTQTK